LRCISVFSCDYLIAQKATVGTNEEGMYWSWTTKFKPLWKSVCYC